MTRLRRTALALFPLLLVTPTWAQETPAPTSTSDTEPAEVISDQIFGPRVPTDDAFGAFQRGYFLTALELALPRAEKGEASAQTLIAELYAKGLGVVQNDQRAAGWYQLASNNGDMLATFELALMYEEGTGVPKNRARAAALFSQAADAGYMPAKYNLALLHIEGIYASPSLTTAASLMKEAADTGLPEAEYDYGTMLIEGAGVIPDPALGAEYILKAAEQNLVAAQIDYATLLYMGEGVAKDIEGAAAWYRRAAEAGNAVAQNRYAKLLAVGEGVALDLQEAAMWRALARRQGINDTTLDSLLISIPPEDLAAAEERARFWPSAPPTTETAETILEIPTTSVPASTGDTLPTPTEVQEAPPGEGTQPQDP
ncbi:tetratricopeptide repeat protein [Devosia aquimaris]|uniref:tetratricopeptide repeat protein n=1 Tax=Devosia aquimaris TaxID=2866214 RepID=UPI001CD044AE|nr:tetratricopeptide repeat protein [Devosia sp. CJK-A8-3]